MQRDEEMGKFDIIEWFIVLPDDDGIRPAGKQDRCFYCGREVGEYHVENCVMICRNVKVRYSFEIDIEVPAFWGKKDIEFHRNESRWCADNAIVEIETAAGNDCTCDFFKAEVIDMGDGSIFRSKKE